MLRPFGRLFSSSVSHRFEGIVMSAQETLIALGIAAVVLVAFCAIVKGRGIKFAAQRGETKLEMDVTAKREEGLKPSGESETIKDVSVLGQGKVENSSNVNIHIGHNIKRKKN